LLDGQSQKDCSERVERYCAIVDLGLGHSGTSEDEGQTTNEWLKVVDLVEDQQEDGAMT